MHVTQARRAEQRFCKADTVVNRLVHPVQSPWRRLEYDMLAHRLESYTELLGNNN